mgnify:CR=1 FL=1
MNLPFWSAAFLYWKVEDKKEWEFAAKEKLEIV